MHIKKRPNKAIVVAVTQSRWRHICFEVTHTESVSRGCSGRNEWTQHGSSLAYATRLLARDSHFAFRTFMLNAQFVDVVRDPGLIGATNASWLLAGVMQLLPDLIATATPLIRRATHCSNCSHFN